MKKTRKWKKMDPNHAMKIQFMYQLMNIRGKNLLDKWKQYPKSTVYAWAAKPYNGNLQKDKRQTNPGRPCVLFSRDERNILRSLLRLRSTKGHFTSIDIQNESGLAHVSNRIIRNTLRKNNIYFLRSRKKGTLSPSDLKKRHTYCRQAEARHLDLEF